MGCNHQRGNTAGLTGFLVHIHAPDPDFMAARFILFVYLVRFRPLEEVEWIERRSWVAK
jgi:hypothetical protein